MFNSKSWCKLSELTYGYTTKKFSYNGLDIFYFHVINEIGEYIISPPFGDFIHISAGQFEALDRFYVSNNGIPVKMKVFSEIKPKLENYEVNESGFIHQIKYNSHQEWRDKIIKFKFRNKIVQSEKKGVLFKILSDIENLKSFYTMHAVLRIKKFKVLPQPWNFFQCIYDEYFTQNNGFIIHAYDPEGNLIAGILFIIAGDTAYYKFSASYKETLHYRPNNLLMDRLIRYCSKRGLKKLNLGYTGGSRAYQGLRKFKIYAGAREYPRYMLKTSSYSKLNTEIITQTNNQVFALIKTNQTLDEIDRFSRKYYKYFI